MEIKDRLLKIITSEGVTAAAFADAIGVQRSSISHILSGRNKPGLDFLQKILNSYSKYNAEWLLMGMGDIYKRPTQSNLFDSSINNDDITRQTDNIVADDSSDSTNTSQTDLPTEVNHKYDVIKEEDKADYGQELPQKTENIKTKTKKIEKIVVFYSNKTFNEYYPE